MKKCPKCHDSLLKKIKLENPPIELDKCLECQGVWFDDQELDKLLASNAADNFSIPDFVTHNPNHSCPVCNEGLYECLYPDTEIMVDACKNGHGIWLDNNEWKQINHARDKTNRISCPKCSRQQPESNRCIQCGFVFNQVEKKPKEQREANHTVIKTDQHSSDGSLYPSDKFSDYGSVSNPGVMQSLIKRPGSKIMIVLFLLLFIFMVLEDILRHGDKIKYGYINVDRPFTFEVSDTDIPYSININTRSTDHRIEIHLSDPDGKIILHHFEIQSKDWDRDYFFTPEVAGTYRLELELNELSLGSSLIDVEVYQNDRRFLPKFEFLYRWLL